MAEKSLFFNAFPDPSSPTGYDRNYNADDLSDWFSIVCETGVLKAGLAVSAGEGLAVSIGVGKATIKGKGYVNNAALALTMETAPTGSSPRYDLVVLRMDNTQTASARRSYLAVVTGTTSVPTVASLTRTADIYELLLAYVAVQPNATSIQQANITDTRGDQTLCPWFTAVKGYDDYYDAIVQRIVYDHTLEAARQSVTTNIASSLYNSRFSLIDVYTNGMKEEEGTDYTIDATTAFIEVQFTAQKAEGSKISVVLSNFIDGEGLSTAIGQYSAWVQAVEALQAANEHTYVCNGLNDNVQITNLVNAFLSGGAGLDSMRLRIVGTFGCLNGGTSPVYVGGSGTAAIPYRVFEFSLGSGKRKVVLDFSDCSALSIPIAGVYASAFKIEGNVEIVGLNLNVDASANDTHVTLIDAANAYPKFSNCRFFLNCFSGGIIAKNGSYTNCRGEVRNSSGVSWCFNGASFLEISGGDYRAYSGSSNYNVAVLTQTAANAVAILYGVNMPTDSLTGYYQREAIHQLSGGGQIRATDLVTTLPVTVSSGVVRDTIAINKVIDF